MRKLRHIRILLAILAVAVGIFLLPALGLAQTGGGYDLSWSTIDGGGGQSAGGQYKLTGTMGQPDADYLAGGNYELLGGFWPGGSVCMVEFEDFARFAESWLQTGMGLAGDIDQDNDVDMVDLSWLADFWLCTCPTIWPLK